MQGKLYVVATPIGNLSDLSFRAVEILKEVDFIAAEDTRVTLKLLHRYLISKPMLSYYEHSSRGRGEEIIGRILAGENCALVSDAGTPLVSDPGEELIGQCADAGIDTVPIPGPSAAIAALCVSGLFSGRFTFEGFLSVNNKNRRQHLMEIQNEKRTMIFYEAPHKLKKTLADLYETFGDRRITLARELTKIHEEIIRTTLKDAARLFLEQAPRGEFVLVLEGNSADEAEVEMPCDTAADAVNSYINQGISLNDAVRKVSAEFRISKNKLYKYMMQGK